VSRRSGRPGAPLRERSRRAPQVVALVPTWRASGFIAQTLDALAAQSHPWLEILVSDDASPDDTARICEAYAARDWRFRVIRQPQNLGWTGNVNALLREARGDYFLFAFQDDLPEPDYVARCVAVLESRPGAVMAFSDITLVHQDGARETKSFAALDGVTDRLQRSLRVANQQGSWWIPNRGVFRASAAKIIGGLRRHLAGEFSADWPWLVHMSLLGEFVRIPQCLCTKIYQPRSLSRGWSFGARSWSAATLSAMTEVARANISTREKLVLHGALAGFAGHQVRRAIRRALRRPFRGRRNLHRRTTRERLGQERAERSRG
jgi:glycosyltransferase involved in cell wall biosynthesis